MRLRNLNKFLIGLAVISGGLTGTVLSNSNIHSSLVIGYDAEFSSTEVTINNFTGLEIDCINKSLINQGDTVWLPKK